MSYRPITDMWILARARLKDGSKYYGAYPGGFLERARALLGVNIDDPVLHVCAGKVREYPYRGGFGPYDKTLDLDDELSPDYLLDAREPYPLPRLGYSWAGVLADPPYTAVDADHYTPGSESFPPPNQILRRSLEVVRVGGRVGILHYILPQPPKDTKFIAAVGVLVGFNNRVRIYSVFEKC